MTLIDEEYDVGFGGYCDAVKEFTEPVMKAQGKEIPETPIEMSPVAVDFLCKMIKDEMQEFVQAKSSAEQADAMIDIIYYIMDSAIRHGINLDSVFAVVHLANMTKVIDGQVTLREDGKVEKPEGFEPPNIDRVIEAMEELGSW